MSEPVLVSIREAGHILGIGRSKIYELLGQGDLESVKLDGRRLVVMASIKELIQKLREAA